MMLTIDPGVSTGWAIFEDTELIVCGLGVPESFCFDLVVIEHPMVYPGGKTKDPNAILKLAIQAGEYAGRAKALASRVHYVLPRAWKGTIDPDICNARIWGKLSPAEQRMVDREVVRQKIVSSKRHNVLDAIGIGLFVTNRWTIKPAIPIA